jgi:hypothetical protein
MMPLMSEAMLAFLLFCGSVFMDISDSIVGTTLLRGGRKNACEICAIRLDVALLRTMQ